MLIAGNWKMNTDLAAASQLAQDVEAAVGDPGAVQVVVCPPFISLDAVFGALRGSKIQLGAQHMHHVDAGAYTGEVSAPMLRSVGCDYVILGHSERRQYFGATDPSVNARVKQALAHGLVPIVCVGETLDERQAGRERDVVQTQIAGAFDGVSVDDPARLVVAYEPVWAIGTGETATPEQAQQMHAFIRVQLRKPFGETFARDVHLLYGGSMKPNNAATLLLQQDVDGGLIGGASLKADAFAAIVRAAQAIIQTQGAA